jgi:hypothetical protein
MDVGVVLIGLAVLALLAGAVGLSSRDESVGRDRAWRDIATERRRNWEERQRLRCLLETLDRCHDCPYRPRPDNAPFG